MKDLKRFAEIFVIGVVFIGPVLGQTGEIDCDGIYQRLVDNRNGPELHKLKTALTSGNEYLGKCSDREGGAELKGYVTKQIPRLTEKVKILALVERFDSAVTAKRWDDAISSGKELISLKHPASLDIMIVLASIGYSNATAAKQSGGSGLDTINDAKSVLQQLETGAASENYGALQFAYRTKACPDGRANAASWMNYIIGEITFSQQKQRNEAIPYLVKAQQNACELKDQPEIYRYVGMWYTDEVVRLTALLDARVKAAAEKENVDTAADEALINGYLDRAIDAYARSALSGREKSRSQAFQDAVNKKLHELYDTRYDGNREGMETRVSELIKKPFPDPSTPVQPVTDPGTAPTAAPATSPKTASLKTDGRPVKPIPAKKKKKEK